MLNISFPPSIFGARCDILMDIVVVSMVIILPLLWYSFKKVKEERNYKLHKNIQLTMFIILFFVVLLFEYDMKQNGGIFAMVKGSAYEGTFFLNFMIYFHTFLSITTSLIWFFLIIASLIKFGSKNPHPGKFSRTHKFWGKIGMWDMALTCITGLILYIFGFLFYPPPIKLSCYKR